MCTLIPILFLVLLVAAMALLPVCDFVDNQLNELDNDD